MELPASSSRSPMRAILLVLVLHSTAAHAGSDSRDCETADKRIVMGGGNSPTRVQIKYVDKDRQPGVHDVLVKIMPKYDYNLAPDNDTITAVPISSERFVSKKHEIMHVRHKDGTSCDGRERWDDRSVQSYVLMGKDGQSLSYVFDDKTVKGMTADGYIIAEFRCHSYGVTSPGGCFADEGDQVTWR
jgi:hypothetical protein